jgi:hypothetical protein
MTLRDSSLRAAAALAVFAAALLVAGCGGGKSDATPGNPSNNTSVCAYTKRVGSGGRVWVQMAVTPVSLEPTACRAFNGGFGGRRLPPVGRTGTGHVYCGYAKSGSSYTIQFACSRPAAGPDSRSAARSTPATASGATCERADITV